MASLSEMLQYAQAKQRPDPLAQIAGNFIESAGNSYFEEKKYQREQKAKKLDQIVKLMDIQEKMANIKQKSLETQYTTDYLKSMGIMPYDAKDDTTARVTAGESLGTGKEPVTSNTMAGRLRGLFDKNNFSDYNMEVTMGMKGIETKLTPKKSKTDRTAGDSDTRNKNIHDLATKMAQRDNLERLSTQTDANNQPMFIQGVHNPSNFVTPPELIDKWIPYATDIMDGLTTSAKTKEQAILSERNPLNPKPKKKSMTGVALSALGSMFGR